MIASLIMLLYLTGVLSVESATTSLYVAGVILLVAEIGVISFGLLALNGLIALYAAYTLQTGADLLFGLTPGWPVMFGIAFVEFIIILAVIFVYVWIRGRKTDTGTEGMIGQDATVLEWSGTKGRVRVEGEIWRARSKSDMELQPDDTVKIEAVNKLDLTVTA